ncbi:MULTISPECIES: oligosaccharide flippase family protein [Klebsiella pneumoniae complex]|uniref:oligosaccharide flippase family protein n=1 Tax=Klebsiella pneumoniae complex TaxID=3390273 RepID=UPI00352B413B
MILLMVQIVNYIFPLISIPYLAKTLGVYNYGIIAIYLSLLQYATIIVDFGFSFISVRRISISIGEEEKINKIFSLTIYSKILIFLVLFLFSALYFYLTSNYNALNYLGLAAVSIFFGMFESSWLFQGLEKLAISSIISVLSRTVSFACIFWLVKEKSDIYPAIFCTSMGTFFSGVLSFAFIYIYGFAYFTKVTWEEIKIFFRDGFDIFISNITITFYTTLNTILLGYFAGPTFVGYFSIADKLRFVAQGILTPVQQALLPRVNRLINDGCTLKTVMDKYGKSFIILGAAISFCLYLFGYMFIKLYFGVTFLPSVAILFTLAPLPFVISIAYVYGPWWLVGKGMLKIYRKTYLTFSLLHLGYAIPLIYSSSLYGIGISILITEVLITISFYKKASNLKIVS